MAGEQTPMPPPSPLPPASPIPEASPIPAPSGKPAERRRQLRKLRNGSRSHQESKALSTDEVVVALRRFRARGAAKAK